MATLAASETAVKRVLEHTKLSNLNKAFRSEISVDALSLGVNSSSSGGLLSLFRSD